MSRKCSPITEYRIPPRAESKYKEITSDGGLVASLKKNFFVFFHCQVKTGLCFGTYGFKLIESEQSAETGNVGGKMTILALW